MARLPPLAVLFAALGALAHGDHSFDLSDQADNALSYAERHVRPRSPAHRSRPPTDAYRTPHRLF